MAEHKPVLIGYDGSSGAATAIEIGARLLRGRAATVATTWSPAGARGDVTGVPTLGELTEVIEERGRLAAEERAAQGAALAAEHGWVAEPLTVRGFGGDAVELAGVANDRHPAAVVVGARGLSGVRAALGSVSDMVVHYSAAPVLVVPDDTPVPADDAPVLVGYDGSEGADRALAAARELFPDRPRLVAIVGGEGEVAPPAGEEVVTVPSAGVRSGGRAVADALRGVAEERGAAVVVVGSRGRSAVRELLLGSVAMATLHHVERPVLVVRA